MNPTNIRRGGRLRGTPVNRITAAPARDDPESQMQQSLMRIVREHYLVMPELRRFHSVPNSTKTTAAIAGRMKREGVERGVHDLHWDLARGGWHGLTVEMKAAKNTLSKEQKEFAAFYASQGTLSVACYSDADAWAVIQWYYRLAPTPAAPRTPLPPHLEHMAAPTVHRSQTPETAAKRQLALKVSRAAKFYEHSDQAKLKSASLYPVKG